MVSHLNGGLMELFPDVLYTPKKREITCSSLVTTPELIMKTYCLNISNRTRELRIFDSLVREIENPGSGVGVSIITPVRGKSILYNCNVWHKQILYPTMFLKKNEKIKRTSPEKIGSFCAYDLMILEYENRAWIKFLHSERTTEDKQKYLNTWAPRNLFKDLEKAL